jgi:hypothetical protein
MKHNAIILTAILLLNSTQIRSWEWPIIRSWEWPMSFKLGWFGSCFMNKEEKYFNNLITRIEKEKASQASPKFGSFQQNPDKVLASSLLIKSYEKNLKRLMTPINDDDENLRNEKMILRRNFFIHGAINNLLKSHTTKAGLVVPSSNTEPILSLFAIEASDKIQPEGNGPDEQKWKNWHLPHVDKTYNNGGYKELANNKNFNNEFSTVWEIYTLRKYTIHRGGTIPPDLQDQLRNKALSYVEELTILNRNVDTHNKSVEKNKTLYTALLRKHGIKLE